MQTSREKSINLTLLAAQHSAVVTFIALEVTLFQASKQISYTRAQGRQKGGRAMAHAQGASFCLDLLILLYQDKRTRNHQRYPEL